MKFKRLYPNQWEKYKEDILFLDQKVFSGSITDPPEYIKAIAKNPKSVFIIAEDKNMVIGDSYGSPLEDIAHLSSAVAEGNPRYITLLKKFPTYGKQNTIYGASRALLLEYRKKGYAIELKKLFISEAKKEGYKFMTSFVNTASLRLDKKFGARVIHTLENWFNTGETYYQYYMKL